MLDKFKAKFNEMSKNGVTIPIKPMMLEQLIKRQSGQKDCKVEITSDHLIIRCKTETNSASFVVTLKPVHIEKRVIVFEIESKQPTGLNMADMKIFNNPPFSEYTNHTVKMDFNSWDIVSKVPVGKIKSYEMDTGTIKLTLSI